MATLRKGGALTRYPVAVRVLDGPNDRGGASSRGAVRHDLELVSLDRQQGPTGGSVTLRPFGDRKYALASDPDVVAEELTGALVTVEVRRRSNRRNLQQVVFTGCVASRGIQASAKENAVDLYVRDPWYLLADTTVDLEGSEKLTGGQILATLNGNLYTERRWDKESQEYVSRITSWDPPPLTEFRDGKKLFTISGDLFRRANRVPNLKLQGQTTAQIIHQVIEHAGLIPDIEYDKKKVVIVGRERGWRKRYIRIGRVMRRADVKFVPDVVSIRGSVDYSKVVNRVIGRGDRERTTEVVDLLPTWTSGEAASWLSDASYASKNSHSHVARAFRVPMSVFPFGPKPTKLGGAASPEAMQDRHVLWERDHAGALWKKSEAKHRIEFGRGDGDVGADPLDRADDVGLARGNHALVVFEQPQRAEYYTDEQRAARESGEAATPTVGIKQFQIQCVGIGDELVHDTGVVGDFPRERVRPHFNRSLTKFTDGVRYEVGPDGERVAVTALASHDATDRLVAETDSVAADTSVPEVSVQIVLWWEDWSWMIGDEVEEILDSRDRVVDGDLGWIVERVKVDRKSGTTTLECSNVYAKFLTGVRL
ncbi:MAG: hypothetical protein GHCLOJNM_01563 [bacterium]|nr:hypothetical protein [bacterium]